MKWKTPFLFLALPLFGATALPAQGPEGIASTLTINGAEITVSTGALIDVRGPVTNLGDGFLTIDGELRVHDWITNNGNTDLSSGSGSVVFFGPNFQLINGTHASTFPDLVVSKPSGNLALDQNVTVEGDLILDQGGLDLNGRTLTLSPTSSLLGENDSKYVFGISGQIAISLPLNAPNSTNVAGLGAVITSGANLGVTTVIRGHEIQTGNGFESIERYYEINPANNSNLNATLVFRYLPHELNGQAEEKFILYRSADGGATWQWGGGTANAGGNHVLLSGISSFSRWTVSNKDTNPISGIGEATAGKTGLFSVFPNPAQVDQPLTLGLIEQGDYTLEVIDEQGRVVSQLPFSSSGPAGTSELQPGVSTPGAYYLLIRDRSALRRIYAAAPILIH